jgi:ABC-type Na+ efflux pump permease subunit
MIPLTSPIVMLYANTIGVPCGKWQLITLFFATFFAVVWFAAKIYRIGILMYGKTNMERAVQMVAILVEIKFGSEWFDFVSLQSTCFPLSRNS